MADAKITELTGWTTPIATDVLPIVDITAGVTKKIAYSDLTKGQVAANGAIVAATKTKITYDTKGLVTVGADATTADIADSSNARYCTDAQKTVIGNTSGTNSGDEVAGQTIGFTITKGTTPKTLTVALDASVAGTNTGDQSVPVKAIASEVDTGTDDAKFVTALSISSSHNVPNTVPSTLGNILTSDGTDWISAAAPAGGDVLMTQVFF